jgi:hypothetical protein
VGNYWGIRHQLSVYHGIVLFGKLIVIPQAARKNVHKKLHAAHQGIVRTNRRAQQTVYWPGITNEIPTLLSTCSTCQDCLSSNQQEPMMSDPLTTHVFEDVSADLFQSVQLHVLVYADRLSGWPTDGSGTQPRGKYCTPSSKILSNSVSQCVSVPTTDPNSTLEFSEQPWTDGASPSAITRQITVEVTATWKRL